MLDKLANKAKRTYNKAGDKVGKNTVRTAVGAAATGLAPAAGIAYGVHRFHKGRVNRPGWQLKQMYKADVARMQQGPQAMGLSDTEMDQMRMNAMAAQNQQTQAQQQALAQQAMGTGEFNEAQFQQAQQQVAAAGQAAAQATEANVQSAKASSVDAERKSTEAAMVAKRAENQAKTKAALETLAPALSMVLGVATGGVSLAGSAGTGAMGLSTLMNAAGGANKATDVTPQPAAPEQEVIQVPYQGPTSASVNIT
jgi:hypothetical protein